MTGTQVHGDTPSTPNDMNMPLVVRTHASLSLPLAMSLNVHVTVMPRGTVAAPRLVTFRLDILLLVPGYHAVTSSSQCR